MGSIRLQRRFRLPGMLLAGAALFAPLAVLAASSGDNKNSKSYMWVDEKGQRHYGDSVPHEYSQAEQRVLNGRGVEVGRIGPPKSAAQLAEERRQIDAVRQREQHDRFLMTTYTSTHDIERLRDERMVQVDGQITAAVAYIDSLQARLKSLQERAVRFKPYSTDPKARRMPDDLAEELSRSINEVRTQKLGLEDRRRDALAMRAQFEADIKRYKELSSRSAVPAVTATVTAAPSG